MSTEAHTIPDETVSRVARLINAAEDQRQQAAEDLKQIYADLREELRGLGWTGAVVSAEVAALKGAISEMRLDEEKKAKREERGERVDDYLSLLIRARARGERNADRQDGEANAKLIATVAAGMQTEIGRKALVTALDIMIEREEAEETHQRPSTNDEPSPEAGPQAEASPAGTGAGTLADREGRSNGEAASTGLPINSDQPLTGGDHDVASSALRAGLADPTSNTGEGAANTALPAKPKISYRPNCQHPENCASGSRDHCWSCRRAMQKSEEAA